MQPLRGAIVRTARVPSDKPDPAPSIGYRTAEDGKFILRGVAPGIVNFYVMKSGYTSGPYASVRPAADGERVENVVLTVLPAASISGRVIDDSGQPIAGARVITGIPVQGDATKQRTFSSQINAAVTDSDGQYWIGGLPAGEYAVVASPYGQTEATRDPSDPTFGQTITVKLDVGEERTGIEVVAPFRSFNTRINLPNTQRGTSIVAGRVVDTSGRSIPNAIVLLALAADDTGRGLTASTDSAGNFRITDVPAGTFGIGAIAPGFPAALQHQGPTPTPMPLEVKDGSLTDGVVLTMRRGAVISGALTDEYGDPVVGTVTVAGPYRSESGVSGRSITTDARGRYRMTGLEPGEYLLSVQPPASTEVHFEDQPGHESVIATSPQFYPGVPRASLATRVAVGEDNESTGIDFVLRPVAVARIDVTITSSRPVSEIQLHHIAVDDRMAIQKTLTLMTGSGATLDVAPGRYRLIATATSAPAVDKMVRLWSMVDVDADPLLPATTNMSLEPGATLSGRAVFESATNASRKGAGASLLSVMQLQGTKLGLTPGNAPFDVATGRFSMEGILPGRYVIQAAGSERDKSASWVLKAAAIGGRDVLDQPIALTPGLNIDDAVLTLTDRVGEISGTITDASGKPATGGWVVLFSADNQQWYAGSRRTRVVRPDDKGAYVARPLPAGSYIVAFSPDFVAQDNDVESTLRTLVTSGARVTIAEGERKVQDLRSRRR
jgi:protocatechuate 3,4-dioxygenase beta subunit